MRAAIYFTSPFRRVLCSNITRGFATVATTTLKETRLPIFGLVRYDSGYDSYHSGYAKDKLYQDAWNHLVDLNKKQKVEQNDDSIIAALSSFPKPLSPSSVVELIKHNWRSMPLWWTDEVVSNYYGPLFCDEWKETNLFKVAEMRRKIRQNYAIFDQCVENIEKMIRFDVMHIQSMNCDGVAYDMLLGTSCRTIRDVANDCRESVEKICDEAKIMNYHGDRVIALEIERLKEVGDIEDFHDCGLIAALFNPSIKAEKCKK